MCRWAPRWPRGRWPGGRTTWWHKNRSASGRSPTRTRSRAARTWIPISTEALHVHGRPVGHELRSAVPEANPGDDGQLEVLMRCASASSAITPYESNRRSRSLCTAACGAFSYPTPIQARTVYPPDPSAAGVSRAPIAPAPIFLVRGKGRRRSGRTPGSRRWAAPASRAATRTARKTGRTRRTASACRGPAGPTDKQRLRSPSAG